MLNKLLFLVKRSYFFAFIFIPFFYCQLAWADLPPAPQNSNFTKGDYIAGIWDLLSEIFKYGSMALAAITFFGYAYAVVGAFIEAKEHRKWGHFGVVAIVGAFVVVLTIVLATVINSHFTSST